MIWRRLVPLVKQATPRAIPRPPSHLISAPLQSTPPETGAALFREPRGKELEDESARPYPHHRPSAEKHRGPPPFPDSNDLAAVLAVKGPLRRSAPLTAPGRREKGNLI